MRRDLKFNKWECVMKLSRVKCNQFFVLVGGDESDVYRLPTHSYSVDGKLPIERLHVSTFGDVAWHDAGMVAQATNVQPVKLRQLLSLGSGNRRGGIDPLRVESVVVART